MQAVTEETDAVPTRGETYRPYLDGLRVIAVYLVVVYHGGSKAFSGGFVGVDVFFVLSGFLVTQLLLRDIGDGGAIRFGRFYSRRFRRLLPAAFVTLVASAAIYRAIATPSELLGVAASFKAAFLYVTNWYFIYKSANYFGAGTATNPVLHFWSLAVEEQFYLVWPLLLGGVFLATRRFAHRQLTAIRVVIVCGIVASAGWALWLRTGNLNRAYYGTDARAYELLAGALLAFVPALISSLNRYGRWMRLASVLSFGVLLVLASSLIHLDAIERGIAVTAATCVLIAALESGQGGSFARMLSTKTMTYLGKISYGTYLWHWIIILTLAAKFHLGSPATIAVTAVVATALASLSYQVLEMPVRQSARFDRHRGLVIASGLTLSLVGALVIIPPIVNGVTSPSTPTPALASTAGLTPVPKGINWQDAFNQAIKQGGPFVNCYKKAASACTIVHGSGPHVVLMGDSHAWMFIPTFTEIARRENLTLSVMVTGICPWQLGVDRVGEVQGGNYIDPAICHNQREDAYTRVIPALHPDLVIVTEQEYENIATQYQGPTGNHLETEDQWESASAQSIQTLLASARKVLVIEPLPDLSLGYGSPGTAPMNCLATEQFVEQCRVVVNGQPDALDLFYRNLAAQNHNISTLNLDNVECPFLPICDPIVNGQIVKWDAGHLTVGFAKSIVPVVDADLKQQGLIP